MRMKLAEEPTERRGLQEEDLGARRKQHQNSRGHGRQGISVFLQCDHNEGQEEDLVL